VITGGGAAAAPRSPATVGIVDDHPLVGGGVAALLAEEADLAVVGVARDLAGASAMIEEGQPDVVICDVQLGDECGFSLLDRYPDGQPAFVMYSSHDHPAYHRAAFDGGASAFILKSSEPGELVAAVRAAAAGRTSLSAHTIRAARSRAETPTAREMEIVEALAAGRSNDEIATILAIRPRTVESHLRALFDRIGVASRTEAVMRAVEEGWIRQRSPCWTDDGRGNPSSGWFADREILRPRRADAPPRGR
jgi:DNA-binding NarL/FixJ family response regulator